MNGDKQLITKTEAKKLYCLTDNDLEDVDCITGSNTFNRSMVSYLYEEEDLKNAAIAKHGSLENLEKKLELKQKKKEELAKKKMDHVEFRRKELEEYLAKFGLTIRSDSAICSNYINYGEKSGLGKEEIGRIMSEMKFYFDKTNYHSILGDLLEENNQYPRYDRDDIETLRSRAKYNALKQYITTNYMNFHEVEGCIPPSLKDMADKMSKELYEGKKSKNNKSRN